MSIVAAWVLCTAPVVTDGDTFRCAGEDRAIRMGAIDAPDSQCRRRTNCRTELANGTTPAQATAALEELLQSHVVRVRYYRATSYGRRIAVVCAGGINVSDYMIRNGFARYMPTWNGAARRVSCQFNA